MENLIAIALLVLTSVFLLKDYKIIVEQKKRVLSYVSLVILTLLFIVSLFCTVKFDSFSTILYSLIFTILAFIFFVSILVLTRMIWKPSIWYICLFVPIGVIFSIFLTKFNEPLYTGAMDGFAAVTRFFVTLLVICFIYPLCIFSYKMLKINEVIKSMLIISISVISFVRGIPLSIGVNGYLSDATGDWFLFFCVWLIIIGVYPHIASRFMQQIK